MQKCPKDPRKGRTGPDDTHTTNARTKEVIRVSERQNGDNESIRSVLHGPDGDEGRPATPLRGRGRVPQDRDQDDASRAKKGSGAEGRRKKVKRRLMRRWEERSSSSRATTRQQQQQPLANSDSQPIQTKPRARTHTKPYEFTRHGEQTNEIESPPNLHRAANGRKDARRRNNPRHFEKTTEEVQRAQEHGDPAGDVPLDGPA